MSNIAYIKHELPVGSSVQVTELQKYEIDFFYLENSPIDEVRELERMLDELKSKDTLIIYSLTAIWKSKNKVDVFQVLEKKKIRLISLQEKVDTEQEQYELFYEHIHLFKEVEESIRSLKIRDAIEIRRNSGKIIGRPQISESKQEEIKNLYKRKMSLRDISKVTGISLGTVHKYVTCERNKMLLK
ncbi:recombinase family protein [Vagococcus salmoninarum]|uniref:recombinase family protein n=1 Tax=Vagococcus salmoninarum TaxID=2739 RepID=UPI003F9601B4